MAGVVIESKSIRNYNSPKVKYSTIFGSRNNSKTLERALGSTVEQVKRANDIYLNVTGPGEHTMP